METLTTKAADTTIDLQKPMPMQKNGVPLFLSEATSIVRFVHIQDLSRALGCIVNKILRTDLRRFIELFSP